jgi:hypothetical protein
MIVKFWQYDKIKLQEPKPSAPIILVRYGNVSSGNKRLEPVNRRLKTKFFFMLAGIYRGR